MAVKIGPTSPDELAIILGNPNPPTPGYTETGPISPARMAQLLAGIEADLAELKTKVATLETQVATLQTDVTALQALIVTIQTQITTLQAQIATLQAQVATLITDVLTLQGDVTTLQAQMVAVQAQVVTLNVNVTTLQAQVVVLIVQMAAMVSPFGHIPIMQSVLTGQDIAGLTFGRGNLWYSDDSLKMVYEIDPTTFALINSWATVANPLAGLAWEDVNSIWLGIYVPDRIYELNPNTGAIISQFNLPDSPAGIAFDGTDLWIASADTRVIRRYSTAGALLATIPCPMDSFAYGLTYVAPYLYGRCQVWGNDSMALIEITVAGTARRMHAVPMTAFGWAAGLTWDGANLRLGNRDVGASTSSISTVFI